MEESNTGLGDNNSEKPLENQEKTEANSKPIAQIQEKKEFPKEIKQEKPKEIKPRSKFLSSQWYDKNYKILLFISIAITILVIAQLVFMASTTGDIMKKDVSLTGGTVITVYTQQQYDLDEFSQSLTTQLQGSVSIKRIEDFSTGKQVGLVIESQADPSNLKTAIQDKIGFELTDQNSSTETMSAGLSKSFYKELITALIIAFAFMGLVVFIIFKKPIPSLAVIQAGVTDTFGALAIANIFGFHISTGGIAAMLMLIGYSVDTDIMLTTKVLKRRDGTVNSRIKSASKTGVTMTAASFLAVVVAYFLVNVAVLKEMFFIIAAGLFLDLFTTWLGNAAILKWYCKKKNIQ